MVRPGPAGRGRERTPVPAAGEQGHSARRGRPSWRWLTPGRDAGAVSAGALGRSCPLLGAPPTVVRLPSLAKVRHLAARPLDRHGPRDSQFPPGPTGRSVRAMVGCSLPAGGRPSPKPPHASAEPWRSPGDLFGRVWVTWRHSPPPGLGAIAVPKPRLPCSVSARTPKSSARNAWRRYAGSMDDGGEPPPSRPRLRRRQPLPPGRQYQVGPRPAASCRLGEQSAFGSGQGVVDSLWSHPGPPAYVAGR